MNKIYYPEYKPMNIDVYSYEVYDERLKRAYQFRHLSNIHNVYKYTSYKDRENMTVKVHCYYDLLYEIELSDFIKEKLTLSEITKRKPHILT